MLIFLDQLEYILALFFDLVCYEYSLPWNRNLDKVFWIWDFEFRLGTSYFAH